MKDIIDVSRYQGVINWERLKDQIGGAMLRAVSTSSRMGGVYIDPTFERNYSECKRLGIPAGAYFYTYAQDPDQQDAELAMLRRALTDKELTLPVAADVEDNSLKALDRGELTSLAARAAGTVESWGLYAMVYTYTSFADTALDMDKLSPYDLWIADYRGKRPARSHGMWQYTSSGSLPGITGPVDLNHVYKDYPRILTGAGLTRLRG